MLLANYEYHENHFKLKFLNIDLIIVTFFYKHSVSLKNIYDKRQLKNTTIVNSYE